jgi:hypothetical protein
MRQTISGLVAAIAVVAASAAERLPDPVQQYYYADQGPTYDGPGDFAPYPVYRESAVAGWETYRHRPYSYGYGGGRYADAGIGEGAAIYGYHAHPHFRSWGVHTYHRYHEYGGVRYGYAPRHGYVSHYSLPPRQFYAQHHNLRYGNPGGEPHRYGEREHAHRYY